MEATKPTPERSLMNDAEQAQVELALLTDEFVTDAHLLNEMVACLKTKEELDPEQTVRLLEACSEPFGILSARDVGLRRPARLGEHTEADLSGFEQDYRRFFPDPEHRQILRLASLARDSGKSLCVKATGDNTQQTFYNQVVTEALLNALDSETMADDAKEVVGLLVEYDVIGTALQGRFDQAKLDELRARWPARFAEHLADFVIVAYLSDASAHTAHRQFTDMITGERRPSVVPEDMSLDFLFEPPAADEPLTLTQPYRRTVAALFPERQVTHNLLRDDEAPEAVVTRQYPDNYATVAEGIWSATLAIPSHSYKDVKRQIESFAMATGFPISAFIKRGREDVVMSVTIVRDPSRRFGTLPPEAHEQAVGQLQALFGWERQPDATAQPDVSACVALLEGYDEERGNLHLPVEAVAFLLERGQGISWRIEPTTLISARRVVNDEKRYELQAWDERVMRISGTTQRAEGEPALDQLKALAGSLNQRRFFAEDRIGDKTIAFAS